MRIYEGTVILIGVLDHFPFLICGKHGAFRVIDIARRLIDGIKDDTLFGYAVFFLGYHGLESNDISIERICFSLEDMDAFYYFICINGFHVMVRY